MARQVAKNGERRGDFLGGKYLLEECLGIGGMGEVYQATNVSLGRKVAIKLLNKEHTKNEDDVLRFLREARAAAAVRHVNVVDVFDVARDDDGTPFIVQELLAGQDLEQYLLSSRDGYLGADEALEIMIPVADAIAAAHQHDVVHRDLKPANIFLARDASGRITPKVLDFGACLYQTVGALSAKEQRMLLGTPHYMAPEQTAAGMDVDVRADVWAIGVILFELLAGETPFEAPDANAVLAMVRRVEVPLLRKVAPTAPVTLEGIVHRCLDRDRSKRFDDAAAVREALEAARTERRGKTASSVATAPEFAVLGTREGTGSLRPRRPPTARRRASLLSLSSPDDLVNWDDTPTPPAGPAPKVAPIETELVLDLDTSHGSPSGSKHAAVNSSIPPVLDPRAALPRMTSERPKEAAPGVRATSERPKPPAPRTSRRPPESQEARPAGPPMTPATPLTTRTWSTHDKVSFGGAIVAPALVAFVALYLVPMVTAPLGHALRGESPLASGVLTVLTLVGAAALAAHALGTRRSTPMSVAAGGAVLLGMVMIIVTFSAGEAAELGIPPAGAAIVPLIAPIVPFGLGLAAFNRARDVWLSPYERREAVVFAGVASVMILAFLELSPLGVVRRPATAVPVTTTSSNVGSASP